MNKFKNKLTYDNQLEFKNWGRRNGLALKYGVDYYFDDIYCVDATKPNQPNIKGVFCDGSLTWMDALIILKRYFKV